MQKKYFDWVHCVFSLRSLHLWFVYSFCPNDPFKKQQCLVENMYIHIWYRSKTSVSVKWSRVVTSNHALYVMRYNLLVELLVYWSYWWKIKLMKEPKYFYLYLYRIHVCFSVHHAYLNAITLLGIKNKHWVWTTITAFKS